MTVCVGGWVFGVTVWVCTQVPVAGLGAIAAGHCFVVGVLFDV